MNDSKLSVTGPSTARFTEPRIYDYHPDWDNVAETRSVIDVALRNGDGGDDSVAIE